ncbi:hypothetical protein BAUCODRAFT_29716 [Baudoinia panamericana UAMH 10762]|uniref:Uncharacterized protein n=1 Tax=Baudoinia panamericana (strain UAMH 10762) TaxID=717646 RepID=M2NNZ7_BAUPA|nr:uncharacterized protein BAUCODRAFT_29716 [Baudoinia panamericana UAMH 10762]EMD01270.1 hypothetical protein BAUCODRAFT_29716 [Baudoinia panamericana UAMH 10762]
MGFPANFSHLSLRKLPKTRAVYKDVTEPSRYTIVPAMPSPYRRLDKEPYLPHRTTASPLASLVRQLKESATSRSSPTLSYAPLPFRTRTLARGPLPSL